MAIDIERWEAERTHFDQEKYSVDALPARVVQRYAECRSPWLQPEFCFHVLGSLEGKRVLEVGCGDGMKSVLMAALGARVIGVDISPKAIEAAQERAARQGVSERTQFVTTPLEEFAPAPEERFDCVVGYSILHHILPVLAPMLEKMKSVSKPDAIFVFSEPVAVWQWLRKVRLMLPISVPGTPGERPLDGREFAILREHMPGLEFHYYDGGMRMVNRFLLRGWYEDMSPAWRATYSFLARTDDFLLNKLPLEGFAGEAVFYGKVKRTQESL
jgi:2-polyprenyl-3-methyl-5-hydroxy-6-metoxy-1,4-benzoquinol methylase